MEHGADDSESIPLCIELDALFASDAGWETALLLIRQHPLQAFSLPLWWASGKPRLNAELARQQQPEFESSPVRADVLEFAREQKAVGRRLILTTSARRERAQAAADYFGIFADVVASTGELDLAGPEKLAAVERACGGGPFDYLGGSAVDLPLWQAARRAYLALGPACGDARIRAVCNPVRSFASPVRPSGLVKAMRPHQWLKNLLLLLPLVLAHKMNDGHRILLSLLAFVCFSFAASSIYVLNDLLDLEADRHHQRKRRRPFAAAIVPIPWGLGLSLGLALVSFSVGWLAVSLDFLGMLLLYTAISLSYSLFFKRRLLVDVVILAGLYSLRILAGCVAIDVLISPWLITFATFFFLSLAFVKRYSELTLLDPAQAGQLKGRSYSVDDLPIIESVGPTSGYMAVLVLCLYINSDVVVTLYKRPQVLWLMCPILLYWITRIWFFARRRALIDDPVLFATTDRVSLIAGLCLAAIVLAASL